MRSEAGPRLGRQRQPRADTCLQSYAIGAKLGTSLAPCSISRLDQRLHAIANFADALILVRSYNFIQKTVSCS